MKKHLAHLAAALAVTLLFGAAVGPLSAAAAAPTAAILNEENTAAEESRLCQSGLDLEIEYNDLHPVYQLYLSSAAPDDWVYQWYSTNPAVATVDRNGLVTAQQPGKATIVANTYTTTLRCDVTVVSNVGRVTLNKERLYLEGIGGTAALKATVAAENGSAVPITWTSSNPAAATVDPFGLVTAVGDGEALITATTPDATAPAAMSTAAHRWRFRNRSRLMRQRSPSASLEALQCWSPCWRWQSPAAEKQYQNKSRHAPGKAGNACLLCYALTAALLR
mgnify:CR=1 FL=1